MKHQYHSGLVLAVILAFIPLSGYTLSQSDMQILGVSSDLTQLGVAETWTEKPKSTYCQVRLYQKDQWQPIEVNIVKNDATQCKTLQEKAIRKHHLQIIDWHKAALDPVPVSIKDENDELIPGFHELDTHYPAQQSYSFTLPNEEPWQLLIESYVNPSTGDTNNSQEGIPSEYTIVFRPKLEPIPYLIFKDKYEANHVLLTPIKVLTNNTYGILVITLRDYASSENGFDYHYRPLFLTIPDYQSFSIEQARNTILHTTEYAMPANEWVKDQNTLHPAYRAYLRLRTAQLPIEDIHTALTQSSAAGKLYWLALLHSQNPEDYKATYEDILTTSSHSTQVLKSDGSDWQPHAFVDVLKEQAKQWD